jgi:hypothetical protein
MNGWMDFLAYSSDNIFFSISSPDMRVGLLVELAALLQDGPGFGQARRLGGYCD